jgi:hypothetical protein
VLLWNDWRETDPPIPENGERTRPGAGSAVGTRVPGRPSGLRGAFDGSPFEPPREERLAFETTRAAEELATLFCSTSSIASPDPSARDELRRRLLDLLSGKYGLPVELELVRTRRG